MSSSILLIAAASHVRAALLPVLSASAHHVVTVADRDEALERLERGTFDVLVLGGGFAPDEATRVISSLLGKDSTQQLVWMVGPEAMEERAVAEQLGVVACSAMEDLPDAIAQAAQRAQRHRERLIEEDSLGSSQSLYQRCRALMASTDIEWLQERVLADLAALCDAQSAALWLDEDRGALELRAYRGLLDKSGLSERIELGSALLERFRGAAPWLSRREAGDILHVPLTVSGEPVAMVQLSDPFTGAFRPEHLQTVRVLADFAAIALRNGRKFLALQRLGLRDRETAAYNLSYFTDYASKEIYKARRYGRTFSLLTFSIDNLAQVRLRYGAQDSGRAARGIIRALSRIVRDSDVIAKASEQEFYLLLPETDFFGAIMFVRRAMAAVEEEEDVQEIDARMPLALVAGASTFPRDGEDFDELVHLCRRRMDARRASLRRRLLLDGLDFWEMVEVLLGTPESPRLPSDPRAEDSRRGPMPKAFLDQLQLEVGRELLREPGARGLLYLGTASVRAELPLVRALDSVPSDFAARVYLLGRRANLEAHSGVTPVFLEGDERLQRHGFLLWLSESAAYVYVERPGHGATWGFHSSDVALVDALIGKLQSEYDLQPY